jgi:hypothetical protein
MSVNTIFDSFRLTDSECQELEAKFGRLCCKIYWELYKKNSRNNYIEDIDDILQELRFSIIKAGCYYKRQIYLEECMMICEKYINKPFEKAIIFELKDLWKKRTRHGANRQKFGKHQEQLLDKLVEHYIPESDRPAKNRDLSIDKKFSTYCKAIAWNCQKNIGKKITRERSIRSGLVSLSEHSFLDGEKM